MGTLTFVTASLCVIGLTHLVSSSRDGCARYDVNGCSTPLKLPFFYKKTFTPACNRHDICYRCGYAYGISRSRCDDVFHHKMRSICSRKSWFKKKVCRLFAKAYYKAVKKFGSSRYRIPPSWYCSQTWVPSCLNSL